ALIDGGHPEERAKEPSAEGGADDSDHDVEEQTLSRSHDRASRPSNQSTDCEPNDDVHKLSPLIAARGYPGWSGYVCTTTYQRPGQPSWPTILPRRILGT